MSKSNHHKPRKLRNDFARLFEIARHAHHTGDLNPLRACLASGVNPDSPERDNKMRSLLFKHDLPTPVAKVLLDAKANPRARDTAGFTPLHNTNVAIAPFLLARGADIEAEEHRFGGTPLICHASMGRADMVKFLLDHGANVDARSTLEDTAFSVAEAGGHTEVCAVITAHLAAKRQRSLDRVAKATRPTYERRPAGTNLRRM